MKTLWEFAKENNVSIQTIYRWIKDKRLKPPYLIIKKRILRKKFINDELKIERLPNGRIKFISNK